MRLILHLTFILYSTYQIQFIIKHLFTIKKWCGVCNKICFYSLLQKYAFGAVMSFFFWTKIEKISIIKIVYVTTTIFIWSLPT